MPRENPIQQMQEYVDESKLSRGAVVVSSYTSSRSCKLQPLMEFGNFKVRFFLVFVQYSFQLRICLFSPSISPATKTSRK